MAAAEEDGLTRDQIDEIFDAHQDAPTMTYRYLVAQAIEMAVRMRAPPFAPSREILDAIRRTGLTLIKTGRGYELRNLGKIDAQAAPPTVGTVMPNVRAKPATTGGTKGE